MQTLNIVKSGLGNFKANEIHESVMGCSGMWNVFQTNHHLAIARIDADDKSIRFMDSDKTFDANELRELCDLINKVNRF